MRRMALVSGVVVLLLGAVALGQGGFEAYPGGYLFMKYEVTLEGEDPVNYTLELTPLGDRYMVRVEMSGPVDYDELAEVPLFFTWSPQVMLMGTWWIGYLSMLSMYGEPVPGQTYMFPGAFSFQAEEYITVAGVRAVRGTFSFPDDPDTRVVFALALDPTVPYPVLIREEERTEAGWEVVSEFVLVEYAHR